MKLFTISFLLLLICGCSSQKKFIAPPFGGGVKVIDSSFLPVEEVSLVRLSVLPVDTPPPTRYKIAAERRKEAAVRRESISDARYDRYVERRTKKGLPVRSQTHQKITRTIRIAVILLPALFILLIIFVIIEGGPYIGV